MTVEVATVGEVWVDGGAICVVPAQPAFGRDNVVAVPVPEDSCYWAWMEVQNRPPRADVAPAWWRMLQGVTCAALHVQRWDQGPVPPGAPGCWPLGWIETHDCAALLIGEASDLFPEEQVGSTGCDNAAGATMRSRGGIFLPLLHGRGYEPGVACSTGYGDGVYSVQVAEDAHGATEILIRFQEETHTC